MTAPTQTRDVPEADGALVEVRDVTKTFKGRAGAVVHAVNGVSLAVRAGETLALIGESGSGKSTLGRVILGLHAPDGGEISFDGARVDLLDARGQRPLRSKLTVVFQEPDESLNPRMTVGETVAEPLRVHEPHLGRADRQARVSEALADVSLPPELAERYPRQLSGGQQQRVGIARAIVTRPKFIVLDEPTSSLDLSVRSQILALLARLQAERGLGYLFISHDIHTVRYVSHRIAVMYLGTIVEVGPTAEVFAHPRHPYTLALLSSALSPEPGERLPRLKVEGEIPKPTDLPAGCTFYSRCPYRRDERCATVRPTLREIAPGHEVASFYTVTDEDLRAL